MDLEKEIEILKKSIEKLQISLTDIQTNGLIIPKLTIREGPTNKTSKRCRRCHL